MDRIVLEVSGLEARYGQAQVLHGISFALARGDVVALLGRNGAGKSTTLRSIIGLHRSATGSVVFDGQQVRGLPAHRIASAGMGFVPEDRRVFASLTVMENLETGRQPPREHAPSWTPEQLFELFPNLARMRDRPGGNMSGGEQQMLTIARTLMGNPSMLLLDEPSEGLAPVIVEQMADSLTALKSAGLTLLVSEQNLRFATRVADRALVIEKGELRHDGPMGAFAADAALRDAYLSV